MLYQVNGQNIQMVAGRVWAEFQLTSLKVVQPNGGAGCFKSRNRFARIAIPFSLVDDTKVHLFPDTTK